MQKIKVSVIMGGSKEEQDLSLKSGRDILMYLDRNEFEPEPFVISDNDNIKNTLLEAKSRSDIAFVSMHGKHGRDGKIYSDLEEIGLPHTGSHFNIHALCFNKHASLITLRQLGFNVPITKYLNKKEWDNKKHRILTDIRMMDKPWVLKPNRRTLSSETYFIDDFGDLEDKIDDMFNRHREIVVQPYIDGKFITCGVLDVGLERSGQALHPLEGVDNFSNRNLEITSLPEGWVNMIRKVATRVHDTLGCRGKSQIDMVIDKKGVIHILEVNTAPELHKTSQMKLSSEAFGIEFEDMLRRIILSSLKI